MNTRRQASAPPLRATIICAVTTMASALPNLNDTLGCTFIGILFEIL